jgi:hypothetical protein
VHDAELATIELRRAEIAASRGRAGEALAAADRALERAPDRVWMVERLQISGDLESLQTDARWRALLTSPP